MSFLEPTLNILMWGMLLTAFFFAFPSKKITLLLSFIVLAHGVFTLALFDVVFFNYLAGFRFLFVVFALFLARKSPNFALPLFVIGIVTLVELVTQSTTLQWGWGHYAVLIVYDLLFLGVIYFRASITKCLAKSSIPYLSSWASKVESELKYSIQDMGLIVVYCGYEFANVTAMFEQLVRTYTDFTPMFFYHLYPIIKFPLNLIEILLIFSVAAGYAKGVYTKKQFA